MKKKIVDALKVKFPGVSEAVLSKIADGLTGTVLKDEDVSPAVEKVTFQAVLDTCIADEKQTAVAEYEGKHGLKDGKKVEATQVVEPAKVEPAGDLASQITAAVAAAVKPLQDKITSMEGGKTTDTRKQQLATALEKAPAHFKERYEKDFARLTFKDDADFANWAAGVKADADKQAEDDATKGAVFGRPVGGSGSVSKDKPSDAELDAIVGNF